MKLQENIPIIIPTPIITTNITPTLHITHTSTIKTLIPNSTLLQPAAHVNASPVS